MKYILSFFAFCFVTVASFASHLPGGNVTYECVGPNQYLLTLTLFEDCGTAFLSPANQTITISNDCGLVNPLASLPNVIFQEEVSQLCDAQLMNSECNGGTLPGIFMHTWQGVVTLPAACDSWIFSYTNCCRNNSNNLIGTPNFYFETTMNSATEPCNNSPSVTTQMIPYVCVNQPVTYNLGVYEPDGHTLVYSLVNALTANGSSVPYAPGFSAASPIPGININSLTGDLTFTSTVIGNYVVSVLVEEYNSNGDLVGTLTQDFQFEVINCPANTNPVVPAGISNFTGDGTMISSNEVEMCVGDAFCFELEFTDLNATDSIYITSNLTQALPGATFTQLTWSSPARAEVCWTASSSVASPTSVVFTARDNACPMFGITFYPIIVNVIAATDAGPDRVLCAGDSAEINVTGGEQFTWEALPGGDTIIVGNTFSCDTCADVFAIPSLSTTYVVTSDLSGNCVNTDTVFVDVVPDFAYTLTQGSATSCIGSDVYFNSTVSPAGAYVYSWSPTIGLDDPTISNPIFTPPNAGVFEFALEILGPTGCIKYDTLSINVAAAFAPDFSISVSPTSLVCGDTVNLTTTLLGGNPAVCGLSVNTSCSAPSTDYTVGAVTGQNTTTSYPAPFGNWYRNAKHQFLFTAAELNGMGITGGKITNIAFEVLTINGDSIYRDYTISMGCTSTGNLSVWETGLLEVFSPQNIQIYVGQNDFTLTSAYEWDGISNLVVEVCYNNLNTNFTQNSVTPWTTTAFTSCLFYRSDGVIACTSPVTTNSSFNRPVIRFSTCSTIPDPSNFTFEWIPGTDVDNPTAPNTFALPNTSGNISMVVTDINGGCTDTATVALTVQCCTSPDATVSDVFCFGGSNGSVELSPNTFSSGPYIFQLYNTVSGMLIQWDSTAMGSANFSGLPAGNYQATFEDPTGCTSDTVFSIIELQTIPAISNDTVICAQDTVSLNAIGLGGFTWSSAINLSSATGGSVVFSGLNTELIYVNQSDTNGCVYADSVLITISPLPILQISSDTIICVNDTATLNAGVLASQYVWTPSASVVNPTAQVAQVHPTATTNYQVVATSSFGCSDSATVIVTVNSLPVLDAGVDDTLCFGDTLNLSANGTGDFVWLTNDSISNILISNPLVWPSSTSDYIVELTDANLCANYDTVQIVVNSLPVVDAGIDSAMCLNDSIQLNATGAQDYVWIVSSDLSDPTVANPWTSSLTDVDYIVQGTDNNGCVNIDTMSLIIYSLPIISAGVDLQKCVNDSIDLLVTGGISYLWTPSLELLNANTDSPTAFSTDTTEFMVSGTDINGCVYRDTVILDVNPLPIVSAGFDDVICYADTAQLVSTGTGTFVWSPTDSISNVSITNPLVWPIISTEYIVQLTDSNGCVNSDTVLITVHALPLINAGIDEVICINDSVQLNASGAQDYVWLIFTDLSDSLVSNPWSSSQTNIEYIVQGTDNNGCVNVDSMNLIVNSLPIIDAGADFEMCVNDSVYLLATGAVSYLWTPNTSLINDNTDSPTAFPSDTTQYVVQGTDVNGCVSFDSLIAIVNPLPAISAGADDVICFGDTAQLSAAGTGLFIWTPNDSISNSNIINPMVWPSVSTEYITQLTDSNSCINSDTVFIIVNALPLINAGNDEVICINDSVQLNATGAQDFLWLVTVDLSDSSISNPWTNTQNDIQYIVQGTDNNGCVNVDSMTVTVNSLPIINAGIDFEMCINDSIDLLVTGAIDYIWSPSTDLINSTTDSPTAFPTDTIEYIVQGTDGNSCVNFDTLIITVNPLPVLFTNADVSICLGDSIEINASGAQNYSWSPSASLLDFESDTTVAFPDTTVTYYLTAIDSNMCVNYDSTTVNVFRISTISDTTICQYDSIQLSVFGSPGNLFNWTPNYNLSDNTIANPIATPEVTTTYVVDAQDLDGCLDQDSVTVTVNLVPIPAFGYSVAAGCDGLIVQIADSSSGVDFYNWTFSNGVTSDETDPEVTFDYNGPFEINLEATTTEGCVVSISQSSSAASFDDYYSIYIPNVFTPNDDGENDNFWIQVPGELSECLDVQIYNRWGQMMFKSFGSVIVWDGKTATGEAAPEGVYFFTIDIKDKQYQGTLQLFR
jgi:gliding motility-associated-like protein